MIYTAKEYAKQMTDNLLNIGVDAIYPNNPMIIVEWAWDQLPLAVQLKIQETQDVILVYDYSLGK